MQVSIRFATQDDAQEILEIYAPYVVSTSVTFETTVPRVYDFKRRIASVASNTPFLVCEANGKIAGFAYASAFGKNIAASAWNAYVYVYISNDYQRCNIASALYLAVLSLLKAQGYRKAIAMITASNSKSEAFHSAFGFRKVGTVEDIGFKLGSWHSVSIFEKSLTDSFEPPVTTKSASELDKSFCERNFKKAAKIIRLEH